MCVFSRNTPEVASGVLRSTTERNDAPVVTGRQRNVLDPIDTSKATKRLKKQRQQDIAKGGFGTSRRSPNDLKII